jgi:hypothetical protein
MNERDPLPLLIFLVGFVVVAVVGIVIAIRLKRGTMSASSTATPPPGVPGRRDSTGAWGAGLRDSIDAWGLPPSAAAQHKSLLEEAVAAGTHLEDGKRRCQASNVCFSEATKPSPRITRANAFRDFVGRLFGAPPRYGVESPAHGPHAYCEPHFYLAEQETRAELAEVERARQAALRDVESRLAKFECGGLAERMAKQVGVLEEKKP